MEQNFKNNLNMKIIYINTITHSIGDKNNEIKNIPPTPKKIISPWSKL